MALLSPTCLPIKTVDIVKIVDVPLTMASVPVRLKRNSAVGLLDGLRELLHIGYIARLNSKTRLVGNSVTRIGRSDIEVGNG